ncbi:UNVERIFIED_CONTAM: hypothetical protein FKN15_004438 [Acipenser sinensis]
MHGPPCARPSAQVGAPPGTVAHLVPCSAPPKPQTPRRGSVMSLAFPLPPTVFPLESQRSLRWSRGSHLCLSLHRPGYRPTRRSPLASPLGPSSPDHGPYPEAQEESTHPQAHPKDREKVELCGLEGQNEPEPQGSFTYGGSGTQPYGPAQFKKMMDFAELIRTLEKSMAEMQEVTRKQNESNQQLRQEWGLPTWEQEFPVSQLELVLQKLVWPAPQQESLVPEPEPELEALELELPAPERKPAVPELQQELQLSEEEELPPPEPEGKELPELQQELQLYEEEELMCPAPP